MKDMTKTNQMTLDQAIVEANQAIVAALVVPVDVACVSVQALDLLVDAAELFDNEIAVANKEITK